MENKDSKVGGSSHATQLKKTVAGQPSQASILVVDDEENFLTLLHWFLTQRGYEVATASSADLALDLIDVRSFDIALLDLRLGIGDGLALLDELIARLPKINVFMMTAYPTVHSIRQAFDRGAVRYLTKPVDLQELVKALSAII
jgi:Response regulator containing CheY-like receiver, AAA-type ATPase, and DNA-binding domains